MPNTLRPSECEIGEKSEIQTPDQALISQATDQLRGTASPGRRRLPVEPICELYLSGIGTVEIAERFGCTARGVNHLLHREGVRMRSVKEAMQLAKEGDRWKAFVARLKRFNDYSVADGVATLKAFRRSGEEFSILVDADDLELLKEYGHAWSVTQGGTGGLYAASKRSTNTRLHRFILGITDPSVPVDHINHNGLGNRRCNLRVVSNSENGLNRSGNQKRNKSGIRGVHYLARADRWISQFGGKHVGCFKTKEEAAQAVLERALAAGVPVQSLAKTGLLPL